MLQAALNSRLQAKVRELAAAQYPEAAMRHELPLLIALPTGIHPYNRNTGYFDPEANAMVAYQQYGAEVLSHGVDAPSLTPFIQHELAHWFQYRELNYRQTSTLNTHRHRTWKEACYVATRNLWPEYGLELIQFSPETSRRVDGKIVKVQRAGSMTDVELHHWPRSLPAFVARLRKAA